MNGQAEETIRGSVEFPPEEYRDDRKEESFQLFAISEQKATEFYRSVDNLSRILGQMGQMMAAMQRRMEDLEARQAAVTVNHADVKAIQARIRARADAFCGKYGLTDPESIRQARAAIKRDALQAARVKDLHDVPVAMLPGILARIDGWTSIRFAMDRRKGVKA